jgi:HD superfamily phosphohydrolase
MCNINSLLIPGAAEISRFEHTLGVLRLAEEWIGARSIPERIAQVIRAAAVLHDVQTAPFGHSLQYVLEDNPTRFEHESLSAGSTARYFQAASAGAAFAGHPFCATSLVASLWAEIGATIRGKGPAQAPGLISGSMDLDNIDNVFRLAYHVGLVGSDAAPAALRLARAIGFDANGELCLPTAAVPDVRLWHDVRAKLYTLLLEDWAEFSAKAMLTTACDAALNAKLLAEDVWLLTDAEFLDHLSEVGRGDYQHIGELVRRLRVGDLYQPIILAEADGVAAYSHFSSVTDKARALVLLSPILRQGRLSPGGCIFHPILDRRKTRRSVRCRLQDATGELTIGEDNHRVLLGVFASRLASRVSDEIVLALLRALGDMGFGSVRLLADPVLAAATTETPPVQLELFR